MPNVKINLDKANSSEETSLLFSVSGAGINRFRISTGGIKIIPKDWDNEKQQIKRTDKNYGSKNRILTERLNELESELFRAEASKEKIEKSALLNRLSFLNRNSYGQSEFEKTFDRFLAEKKSEVKQITYTKSYQSFKNIIEDFQHFVKAKINIHKFNEENINQFKDYILNERNNENGGYSAKEKMLRTFFNWCNKKGITTNRPYQNTVKVKHKKEIRPLNKKELLVLENANDSFTGLMEQVRRRFLFLCYTGLRYEDSQKVRYSHIDSNIITINTSKTGKTVKIPLHKKLKALIGLQAKSTSVTIFNKTENQVFNRYLKDIFTELKLNAQTHNFGTKGVERIEKNQTLDKVVSSHDGRRTFITLSLSAGMNAQQLMKITGHEDFKSFERYVNFSDEEAQNRLLEVWQTL